jgi:hypothetical protein
MVPLVIHPGFQRRVYQYLAPNSFCRSICSGSTIVMALPWILPLWTISTSFSMLSRPCENEVGQ